MQKEDGRGDARVVLNAVSASCSSVSCTSSLALCYRTPCGALCAGGLGGGEHSAAMRGRGGQWAMPVRGTMGSAIGEAL